MDWIALGQFQGPLYPFHLVTFESITDGEDRGVDRPQRIADFMGDSGRQFSQGCQPLLTDQVCLCFL